MIAFGWYMNVDVLILDKQRYAFCHLWKLREIYLL